MKVIYDPQTDILTMVLKEGSVSESGEDKPGVVLDYDDQDNDRSVCAPICFLSTGLPCARIADRVSGGRRSTLCTCGT